MFSLQTAIATIISLALLTVTVQLVRKRKLREEYALLWLAASAVILILSVFPEVVRALGTVFDVSYAPTLVLVLGLVFVLAILLSHSVIITTLADHKRDLAQSISILEWQVRQTEEMVTFMDNRVDHTPPLHTGGTDDRRVTASTSSGLTAHANGVSGDHPTMPSEPAPAPDHSTSQVASAQRVLVIGLDGATFDLIEPWAADGYLPTLSRLLREGASGKLRSTIPPITAAAWSSFATGTNPGKHGLYDWIARQKDSYRFSPVTAIDCKAPTIYRLLSEAGRRVCAMNIPMTFPAAPVNGVMVAGLPAPSTKVPLTYPSTLFKEIVDAVGDYILYPDPGQAYSDAGVDAFLKRLDETGKLRTRAFDYLRGREAWDFAMMVFNGTDTVCHAMWKYMDPTHPLHDKKKAEKYGNAIRDYYQFVDRYLGQVVDQLDDNTTLVIMSDHGFGPFHKFIHVNNWLIQLGQMRLRSGPGSRVKAALFKLGFSPMNVYDTMMRLGLGSLKREVVRGQGQGLLKTFFLSFEDVDWSRTRAYSLGNIGQINLNVVGREPLGCVKPGEEYERVRDEIIAQLKELRDPATGEMVVETIFRREEIYAGEQFERAPDILFLPRRLEYFGFGEYEFGSHRVIEAMRHGISGTHRMDGVFLAYGRAIRAGARVEGAGLIDLAPTILSLMGEPIPSHMDGRVLDEILTNARPNKPAEHERRHWDETTTADGTVELSDEDAELLAERLRNLGYVG